MDGGLPTVARGADGGVARFSSHLEILAAVFTFRCTPMLDVRTYICVYASPGVTHEEENTGILFCFSLPPPPPTFLLHFVTPFLPRERFSKQPLFPILGVKVTCRC